MIAGEEQHLGARLADSSDVVFDGGPVAEVNIEEDADAAAYVEKVNGGNQMVPTVVFPDGSAATNPSLAQVRERLGL